MQIDPDISICVVTYRRPGPLARLLASLSRQHGVLPKFEVVVVDNDAAGSAGAVCRQYEGTLPIRYEIEPERGISSARNRSVRSSRGRHLVFADDDCAVNPDWLATLYSAVAKSSADGLIGPIATTIEGDLPEWVRQLEFLARPRLVAGTLLPWYRTHTCNACIRRSALPSAAPFDPALGLIGGEDVDLFARMIEKGARLEAIETPVMEEYRPAFRANAAWHLRRSFRNGGTIAHIRWRRASGGRKARLALHALWEATSYLAGAIPAMRRSRTAAFASVLEAATELGKVAWVVGIVYAEYRHPR